MEELILAAGIAGLFLLAFVSSVRKGYLVPDLGMAFVVAGVLFASFVPIDVIMGNRIRPSDVFIDFHSPWNTQIISYTFFAFFAFISAFSIAFYTTRLSVGRRQYSFMFLGEINPYIYALIVFVILVMAIGTDYYFIDGQKIGGFVNSIKQARNEIGSSNSIYNATRYLSNLSTSTIYISLFASNRKKLVLIAFILLIVNSVYYSDRSNLLIYVALYFLTANFKLISIKSITILILVIFAGLFLKPFANYANETLLEGRNESLWSYFQRSSISLSRFEGLSAFEITSHVLTTEPPGQLQGKTYLADTLYNAVPALDPPAGYEPLNVEYSRSLNRGSVGRFGFSPIAEAYLNFGLPGIPAVGLILGFLIALINRYGHPLIYVMTLELAFRFYRTDFASLFKRYFVVELAFTIVAIIIVSALAKRRRTDA